MASDRSKVQKLVDAVRARSSSGKTDEAIIDELLAAVVELDAELAAVKANCFSWDDPIEKPHVNTVADAIRNARMASHE